MNVLPSKFRKRHRRPSHTDVSLLRAVHSAHKSLESLPESAIADAYRKLRDSHKSCEHSQTSTRTTSPAPTNRFTVETLTQSLALALESLRRTTGMFAYDVQILAGIAMTRGTIAEMHTGEGKTLTTMFPAAALALSGRGVHVATVNAYLADRDFEFLRPALEMLGLTVGISRSGDATELKRTAYACDVTFSTGYELGFDFLRDQIAMRTQTDQLGAKLRRDLLGESKNQNGQAQRGFAAAIIDEIDSVFIDEATTPLVLSSGSLGTTRDQSVYFAAKSSAEQLVENEDFMIDRSEKTLTLTDNGIEATHQFRSLVAGQAHKQNLLRPWRLYVESALRAQHIMIRDINYVVRDDKVEIVDEYTGRIFSDRNWRDGLHQAVEAKENVSITEERKTIAKISRQRYFQRYELLCGMTGTADGHQREFQKTYGLPIVFIPRRKNLIRIQLPTRYFNSQDEKIETIVGDSIQRQSDGQPVLIGTRTIQQSHQLSQRFANRDVNHQVLNGVQDDEEATLINLAGSSGSITVATNMAGRGTDIKLDSKAIEAGGLHVIGFERNSSIRIDRQLLGRSGRQGEPGSGQFFVSAEDEIVRRFDSSLVKAMSRIRKPGGIESRAFDQRIQAIQKAAGQSSYQSRQDVMREELWLDKVKKTAG